MRSPLTPGSKSEPNITSPPLIPRSKSEPDITNPRSPSHTSKSVRTTRSTGSPVNAWAKKTAWPKKFGDYINRRTQNPKLTEASLQEFNRRNDIIEARYSSSSPYYKGLTDFSLDINREKLSGSSPGRESHATSFASSGSKSSFVFKVQEWGSSCFTAKKHDKSYSLSSSSTTKSSHDTRTRTSSSSLSAKIIETGEVVTKIRTKITKIDLESERKKVTFISTKHEESLGTPSKEKPLGERDLEPPSMMPLPPPTAQPPESIPYPQPQIIPPAAQALPSSPPTLLSHTQTANQSSPPLRQQLSLHNPIPPAHAPALLTPAAGVTINTKTNENENKYAWADKYRPFWLQDFLCNRKTALSLQSILRNWDDRGEECSHFIFEGNPGVGKRTMIWALLREAFGPERIQAREEIKEFHLKGEAVGSILVNLKVSPQHIEINLSELKGYEKHVIVELIKEKSLYLPNPTWHHNRENCRAIILYEADKISTDALSYLKWMLEKFKGCNKVFFCCSDSAKLQPIKPICTLVQLLEPSNEEILEVLAFIATREGIQLPQKLANQIANNSKNNLRQAIRSFEATWHFNSSLKEDQDIKTGWEDKIACIARSVIEEQSPKQLYKIRGELQNLIEHNVAPEFIFQNLVEELKKNLPGKLQPQFDNLYDDYKKNHAIKKYLASEHNQQEELGKRQNDPRKNVQQFMRIEEFIARFMSWYKGLVIRTRKFDQIESREAN